MCEWVTRTLHRHKSCWTMQYKPHRWFGTWLIRISIRHVPPHQCVKSISDATSHLWSHWLLSHIIGSYPISMSRVACYCAMFHINESRHVTSRINAPYPTSMSHVIYQCTMSHTNELLSCYPHVCLGRNMEFVTQPHIEFVIHSCYFVTHSYECVTKNCPKSDKGRRVWGFKCSNVFFFNTKRIWTLLATTMRKITLQK